MRKALSVSRSTIEAARAELGDEFEFQDVAAPGQPFYVYSPGWLPAFHEWRRLRKGKRPSAVDDDVACEMQRIRLENMRLDLDERRISHGERNGKLLAVAEVDQMFHHLFGGIKRFVNYELSDAQKITFIGLLKEVTDEYAKQHPERIAARETDAGGAPRDADGGRHRARPEHSKRIKRPARAAAKSTK